MSTSKRSLGGSQAAVTGTWTTDLWQPLSCRSLIGRCSAISSERGHPPRSVLVTEGGWAVKGRRELTGTDVRPRPGSSLCLVTSAGAASEATLLPSSNFSRMLRGLEEKGLVREVDKRDACCVRLYPTDRAHENLQQLRDSWSRALDGIVEDPHAIDDVNATLRHIESGLSTRQLGVSN